VHGFNPSTWKAEAGESEFKASLVYRVSSKSAGDTQRNPISKDKVNGWVNEWIKFSTVVSQWCMCNPPHWGWWEEAGRSWRSLDSQFSWTESFRFTERPCLRSKGEWWGKTTNVDLRPPHTGTGAHPTLTHTCGIRTHSPTHI